MDKRTKLGAGIAGALALAVAVGAAGAIAAERALDEREQSEAVIDDAAGQLGIEPEELSDALQEALKNRVDEAVEDGDLTEEQGEELKERIDSGDLPLVFPGFGRHGGFGHFGRGHFGKLETAAEYLGLTEEQLGERLRDGKTLAEVARAEGKSVDGLVDALVAKATEKIDKAVEKNRLSKEQAAELKEDLEQRTKDLVEGELPEVPFPHRGPGFFGGPGGFGFNGRPGALPGEPRSGSPRA